MPGESREGGGDQQQPPSQSLPAKPSGKRHGSIPGPMSATAAATASSRGSSASNSKLKGSDVVPISHGLNQARTPRSDKNAADKVAQPAHSVMHVHSMAFKKSVPVLEDAASSSPSNAGKSVIPRSSLAPAPAQKTETAESHALRAKSRQTGGDKSAWVSQRGSDKDSASEYVDVAEPVPLPCQTNRCHNILCCARSDDEKVARRIFDALDVEGDNKVQWEEFFDFVRDSYEHYSSFVGTSTENYLSDPVARFRRMLLRWIMNDDSNKEKGLFGEEITDDVLDVLFAVSRKFQGKGYARKTRELFRKFDDNDSGCIAFDEFCKSLHDFAFFDFNIEAHGQKMHLVEWSLLCCHIRNPLRAGAIQAAYSVTFDAILITIIVVNTLVIAMEDPSDPFLSQGAVGSLTPLNTFVANADHVFTALYSVEFIIKVIASGFVVGRGVCVFFVLLCV